MIMNEAVSNKLKHFWKVVSNVRPIVWICLYICLMPLFALVYYLMPDGQFRIPQDAGTDFGSWLYYSIVTITTLGFGELYTRPRMGAGSHGNRGYVRFDFSRLFP